VDHLTYRISRVCCCRYPASRQWLNEHATTWRGEALGRVWLEAECRLMGLKTTQLPSGAQTSTPAADGSL
jgi:hypothetical protein